MAETIYIAKEKTILKAGWANGIYYSPEVVREMAEMAAASGEAFSVYYDHDDATQNWLGEVKDIRFVVDTNRAVGDFYIVDPACAQKLQYHEEEGGGYWGVSPKLWIDTGLEDGKEKAVKAELRSVALVLNPAGGKELMLEQDTEVLEEVENSESALSDTMKEALKALLAGEMAKLEEMLRAAIPEEKEEEQAEEEEETETPKVEEVSAIEERVSALEAALNAKDVTIAEYAERIKALEAQEAEYKLKEEVRKLAEIDDKHTLAPAAQEVLLEALRDASAEGVVKLVQTLTSPDSIVPLGEIGSSLESVEDPLAKETRRLMKEENIVHYADAVKMASKSLEIEVK